MHNAHPEQQPERVFTVLDFRGASLLADIEAQCFNQPWNEGQFAQALRQNAFSAYAMLTPGNDIHAYLSVYQISGELEILNIAVRPEFRGQGLARRLLEGALCRARDAGFTASALEVRESNIPAIGLYESTGYVLAGRRKGYYSSPDEDALIYTLDLLAEK